LPYLLADSFGGLGQQALAQEQNRRLALGQAMGAMQQGMGQMQRGREFKEQIEMERRNALAQNFMRMNELFVRQNEINRQLENDKMRNLLGARYADIQEKALAKQGTPSQERAEQMRVQLANQLAASGAAGSVDELKDVLPKGEEYQSLAPLMFNMNEKANDRMDQDHSFALGQVAPINRFADNADRLAALTKQQALLTHVGPDFLHPHDAAAAKQNQLEIDRIKAEQATLQPRVMAAQKIAGDPRFAHMFAPDPENPSRVQPLTTPSPRTQRSQSMNFINSFGGMEGAAAPDMGDAGVTPSPMTQTGVSAPPSQAAPPTTGTTGASRGAARYPQHVYNTARALSAQGMDPRDAIRKAADDHDAMTSQLSSQALFSSP